MRSDDVVVMIPTKREPPVKTLLHYFPDTYHVMIVAAPSLYEIHRRYYRLNQHITIVEGNTGLAPQIAACYRLADEHGFPWWFRLDDDLVDKTFVHKNGSYPDIDYVVERAWRCVDETETTLAGFMNGANRFWMNKGYGRTYGLIHGGAQLVRATSTPEQYIDARLPRYEDVYRSCSHRAEAGAVGRVRFIGFDKSKSSNAVFNQSSIVLTEAKLKLAKKIILRKWPDYVTCNGTRAIHNGAVEIANWRMKRQPGYTP